ATKGEGFAMKTKLFGLPRIVAFGFAFVLTMVIGMMCARASFFPVVSLGDTFTGTFTLDPSRLPSFSDGSESIGKERQFGEHGSELLDQGQQPNLWHGGDQLVEHAALAEQRMSALLGGI